ncbi:hypothetical protein GUITHDRAFT_145439 [Guillardia theta CCMP2712]|uniref:Uncharacterized protein n=1 Tax=Guillardia theta (strain CCMP2712) TaxID=905079 RepID=L1IKN4_GUITC|nr:hypothetical protein GUITHDRAFT_145439 [Guillardia theta CCMP2712]EKX36803.1 hypothetical protein GUITHDRAFT_145439 [Guillardia theta CCMP2712]|eukprot:XP_005823783.1 hypothetical protein GUITHDRAFT_145439 [Guillardia theta CCMP2712]
MKAKKSRAKAVKVSVTVYRALQRAPMAELKSIEAPLANEVSSTVDRLGVKGGITKLEVGENTSMGAHIGEEGAEIETVITDGQEPLLLRMHSKGEGIRWELWVERWKREGLGAGAAEQKQQECTRTALRDEKKSEEHRNVGTVVERSKVAIPRASPCSYRGPIDSFDLWSVGQACLWLPFASTTIVY